MLFVSGSQRRSRTKKNRLTVFSREAHRHQGEHHKQAAAPHHRLHLQAAHPVSLGGSGCQGWEDADKLDARDEAGGVGLAQGLGQVHVSMGGWGVVVGGKLRLEQASVNVKGKTR